MKHRIKLSICRLFKGIIGVSLFFLCICEISFGEEAKFLYDTHSQRDPFMPLIQKVDLEKDAEDPNFSWDQVKLQGIVVDPIDGSFVMINDEIYQEGSQVGPYTIEQISDMFVVFAFNDKKYRLDIES